MKDYPDDNLKVELLKDTNMVQQDNTNAIQFEQHRNKSSTKQTCHINIRYFYCTLLLDNQLSYFKI